MLFWIFLEIAFCILEIIQNMSEKIEKVNSLIAEELSEIINAQIEFEPGVLVSISRAVTTADLSLVRVFIRCFPNEKNKETIKVLYRNKKMLREELGRVIKMRRIPKISFYTEDDKFNEGEENENKVDEILRKLKIEG